MLTKIIMICFNLFVIGGEMILKSKTSWFNFIRRMSGLNGSIDFDISFDTNWALWHRTKRRSTDSSEGQKTQDGEGMRENLCNLRFAGRMLRIIFQLKLIGFGRLISMWILPKDEWKSIYFCIEWIGYHSVRICFRFCCSGRIPRLSLNQHSLYVRMVEKPPPPPLTGEQYGNMEPKYPDDGHCQSVVRPPLF